MRSAAVMRSSVFDRKMARKMKGVGIMGRPRSAQRGCRGREGTPIATGSQLECGLLNSFVVRVWPFIGEETEGWILIECDGPD